MPVKKKSRKSKSRTNGRTDVLKELGALGKMVDRLVRDAANSSHVKGVKSDVSRGVRSVGRRLQAAIEDAKISGQSAKLKSQAKRILKAGKKEGLQKTRRLRINIARGL